MTIKALLPLVFFFALFSYASDSNAAEVDLSKKSAVLKNLSGRPGNINDHIRVKGKAGQQARVIIYHAQCLMINKKPKAFGGQTTITITAKSGFKGTASFRIYQGIRGRVNTCGSIQYDLGKYKNELSIQVGSFRKG